MNELHGYAGKIVRINLTTCEVSLLSTLDYVPKFIGGRGICNKIFWDEVGPGVQAFDPENKLIIMTGPSTGTGIPNGGRTVIAGIAPQCFPEQYSCVEQLDLHTLRDDNHLAFFKPPQNLNLILALNT